MFIDAVSCIGCIDFNVFDKPHDLYSMSVESRPIQPRAGVHRIDIIYTNTVYLSMVMLAFTQTPTDYYSQITDPFTDKVSPAHEHLVTTTKRRRNIFCSIHTFYMDSPQTLTLVAPQACG